MVGLHKINIISLDVSAVCSASERLQTQRVAGNAFNETEGQKDGCGFPMGQEQPCRVLGVCFVGCVSIWLFLKVSRGLIS